MTSLLSYVIPTPWKWAAIVALLASLVAFGWTQGANHVQDRWDTATASQSALVARQSVKVVAVAAAQSQATQETDRNVQDRIDAVHRYYAGRLRQQPAAVRPGSLPSAPDAAGNPTPAAADLGPVAEEPWGQLAERCAVTTEVARGWQEWWAAIEQAQGATP